MYSSAGPLMLPGMEQAPAHHVDLPVQPSDFHPHRTTTPPAAMEIAGSRARRAREAERIRALYESGAERIGKPPEENCSRRKGQSRANTTEGDVAYGHAA
ncbi:hypothetical protein NL676_013465 [Syzygium grande]|nr:hypothetical protein NL676_013465 [Syzygium grande]